MRRDRWFWMVAAVLLGLTAVVASGSLFAQRGDREARALAEPFVGVTTDGLVQPGLFTIRETGVSTQPVV